MVGGAGSGGEDGGGGGGSGAGRRYGRAEFSWRLRICDGRGGKIVERGVWGGVKVWIWVGSGGFG